MRGSHDDVFVAIQSNEAHAAAHVDGRFDLDARHDQTGGAAVFLRNPSC